ncbi:outer membrane receptor protein involved in Fe transport [Chryseobacterium defluvii]|uniref:Outer membrane receptor protein involved in Fe transport n=1 Tax=Chryseobacterium defluvii TaxID=160396 RepID=A0A840KF41_9FLAO|nr:TonB-dependent receptor [Chryseobacterium defluvii]MBB4806344.1 outer membrane receptor protein involved in Fe transport [Chryseobacterium defluvii]
MKRKSILLFTGIATLYFNQAYAQETPQDSTRTAAIDQVVITGSANPKKKIESSTAISTFSAKEIQKQNPVSTAALLQKVPGFAVETSGGEVGNNLFARGIPSAGAYEYVQVQEDGLPVFEDGALQFANADAFFRVDATTARLEALRGGSGSIFASNAPGGIINFISKEGSNKFTGMTKLETSTYGLMRVDGNFGGALVEDKLFLNVGGFYRVDNGIRNPGYKANNGGQIKLNLKYVFDKGFAKVYYKKLNDRNLFLLPIPLMQEGDKIKEFPGFDANYGTYASRYISKLRVPQVGGGYFERDLENGVNPNVDVLGGEFKYDLGENFSVSNKMKYTNIDLNYTAIFPSGTPTLAKDFANGYTTSAGMAAPILGNNYQYSYADNGQVANPMYVQKVGFWAIDKKMNNFANDLRFDYKIDNLSMALGFYKSAWKSSQSWNWSNLLVETKDHTRLLNLVDTSLDATDPNYSRTYNGVSDISWLVRNSEIQGSVNALYFNADFQVNDKLNLNGGIRYDNNTYKGVKDKASWGNQSNLDNSGLSVDGGSYNGLNGFNTTTADNSMLVSSGPYYYWRYDVDKVSATAAGNYKFNQNNAAFARYSHGFRSPIEEAYYDNAENLDKIKPTVTNQFELGFKHYQSNFDITAILFSSALNDIAFTDILSNGQSENAFGSTKNYGLELETNWRFFNRLLEVSLNGTIQDPTFKEMRQSGEDLEGNTVRRIPKLYFTISPAVNITKEWRTYVNLNYYGMRYADNFNKQELPSFTEVGAGMSYQLGKIRFAVDATNIFNTIGLTEGDPRSGATGKDGIIMARPIMGAAARASITLDF